MPDAYLAISTNAIPATHTTDSQREEYATRHNMKIVGTYIDLALSAKTDDRPEFQKMIRDSEKKQFEIVLVWIRLHTERFSNVMA